MMLLLCFFFSSRRRHTRLTCDWSSDVCSSDLERATDALEGRMGCRIGDPLAAEPDLASELAHRAQVVVARTRTHQRISCSCGRRLRSRSAASSGAMYGGRAGPMSMPVATEAVTLVTPR